MGVVRGGSTPAVVVVGRQNTATVVRDQSDTTVVDRTNTATVTEKDTKAVDVASPGLRGRPGERGPDGSGDNETFDTNLALLYALAKQ